MSAGPMHLVQSGSDGEEESKLTNRVLAVPEQLLDILDDLCCLVDVEVGWRRRFPFVLARDVVEHHRPAGIDEHRRAQEGVDDSRGSVNLQLATVELRIRRWILAAEDGVCWDEGLRLGGDWSEHTFLREALAVRTASIFGLVEA